ncbi:hypothetical protein D9M71_775410 [compost metagenome]
MQVVELANSIFIHGATQCFYVAYGVAENTLIGHRQGIAEVLHLHHREQMVVRE